MRFILRFIWAVLVNVSLVAMGLVIWLWIRSYGGADGAYGVRQSPQQLIISRWQILSYDGAMWLGRSIQPIGWLYIEDVVYFKRGQSAEDAMMAEVPQHLLSQGKFGMRRLRVETSGPVATSAWSCAMPHWLAVVILAHLPAAAMWSAIRQHRRGHCRRCGKRAAGAMCASCGDTRASPGRRMMGWTFGLMAAISVLAFVGTSICAAAAQFRSDTLALTVARNAQFSQTRSITSRRDCLELMAYPSGISSSERALRSGGAKLEWRLNAPAAKRSIPLSPMFEVAGFAFSHVDRKEVGTAYAVALPYWLPMAVLTVVPVLWLRTRLRERRQRLRRLRGLCEKCGYDLRASSGACPECGNSARASSGE
jgi:hypothetical protein